MKDKSAAQHEVNHQQTLASNYFQLRSSDASTHKMKKQMILNQVTLNFEDILPEILKVSTHMNYQQKKDHKKLRKMLGVEESPQRQQSISRDSNINESIRVQQRIKSPRLVIPKQSFCVVCRENFPDYIEHIVNAYHIQKCSEKFGSQISILIKKDTKNYDQIKYKKMGQLQQQEVRILGVPNKKRHTKNTNPSENPEIQDKDFSNKKLIRKIREIRYQTEQNFDFYFKHHKQGQIQSIHQQL